MKNLTSFARNLNRAHSAKVHLLIVAIVVVIGFSMVACDSGGGGGGSKSTSGSNPFVGTWVGYESDGGKVIVEVKDTTWVSYMADDGSARTTGTYTYNGNTARWYSSDGSLYGTVTVSGNKITLKYNNTFGGPEIFTKQ